MDLARYAKQFVRSGELPWAEQYREFIQICSRDRLAALLLARMQGQDGFDRITAAEAATDPQIGRASCRERV